MFVLEPDMLRTVLADTADYRESIVCLSKHILQRIAGALVEETEPADKGLLLGAWNEDEHKVSYTGWTDQRLAWIFQAVIGDPNLFLQLFLALSFDPPFEVHVMDVRGLTDPLDSPIQEEGADIMNMSIIALIFARLSDESMLMRLRVSTWDDYFGYQLPDRLIFHVATHFSSPHRVSAELGIYLGGGYPIPPVASFFRQVNKLIYDPEGYPVRWVSRILEEEADPGAEVAKLLESQLFILDPGEISTIIGSVVASFTRVVGPEEHP
jgi:hypothetical protein